MRPSNCGIATSAAKARSSPDASIRFRVSRPSTRSVANTPAIPSSRQTVDRYVEEFERLLAEVSRDDRDSMLTKTYLTSETGKVYTMLAHASGRLD